MAKKYIDADKLLAEITKYQSTAENAYNPSNEDADYWCGKVVACEDILDIIVSIQQEQPEVDLEKEIERVVEDYNSLSYGCRVMKPSGIVKIARHFYELGKNSKDILSDEPDKSLEEAAEEYRQGEVDTGCDYIDDSDGDSLYHSACLADAFIVGAKWMAGQGVSWEDEMTYYDGFLLYGKDERAFTMEGNFNEGDKVIVQIRKED